MDVEIREAFDSLQRLVVAGFRDLGERITLLAEQQASQAHVFDQRMTEVNTRMDARMDEMNARADAMNARMDDMNQRMTNMVAAFMRARTEDLERWSDLEARIPRKGDT